MCYEERYYSEWTRRSAHKREEPKPAAEPRKPKSRPIASVSPRRRRSWSRRPRPPSSEAAFDPGQSKGPGDGAFSLN